MTAQLRGSDRVRQSPRVASRTIGGKAVVIVGDRRRSHTLSEVGTLIWELADGRTAAQIAATLQARYAISPEQALADVIRFAGELIAEDALEVVRPNATDPVGPGGGQP